MRAIHAPILFIAFLGPLGCGPDLGREAAPMVIQALGLPDDATVIRATLTNPRGTYRLEAPVATFIQSGELVAESVPLGDVAVVAEAVTPRSTLVTSATVRVAAPLTRAIVDFNAATGGAGDQDAGVGPADGGAPAAQRDSSPIPHDLAVNQGLLSSTILTASVPAKTAATDPYPQLLASLTSVFGRAPAAIAVKSVSLGLLPGTHVGVSNLGDVFDGPVTVAFVPLGGGSPIDVATGDVGDAGGPLATFGTRAVLARIQSSLTSGAFSVRIRGVHDEELEPFSASLRLRIIYTAYDR